MNRRCSRSLRALACMIVGAIAIGAQARQQAAPTTPAAPFVPDAGAPFLPLDNAWPVRFNRQAKGPQGVVRAVDVKVTTLAPFRVGDTFRQGDDDKADFDLLVGDHKGPSYTLQLEGPNSIIFESLAGPRKRGLGSGPGPDAGPAPAVVFRFISGEPAPDDPNSPPTGKPKGKPVLIQRTWFAYYEPVGEKAADGQRPVIPTRATVLILPGIFGNPEPTIDPLVMALRRRGYAVLRMLCQPSRFTEEVAFMVDPGALPAAARRIAAEYDNRTAECAYAAEGAWDYVESRRPPVKDLPRVVIGMSGGAITLPAVVARDPARYRGAVLIAGSADYWLTSQRSNYRAMIGAVNVIWTGGAGKDESVQRELDRLYLENTRLDSFHSAAALKDKRLLVLHGLVDQAVPSALGDLLWERLGRPERWTYPLGHELLFAGLPTEFPRLLAWLDAVVDQKVPAAAPP